MKYNYRLRKHKKVIPVKFIFIMLVMLLICISIGYSKFTSSLSIHGTITGTAHEPDLPGEIVEPQSTGWFDNDRLTTNTSFVAGLVNYLEVIEDVYEAPNNVTTKLRNGYIQTWIKHDATITFTLTIQNNSGYTWTNGGYTVEQNNLSQYASFSSASLSKTTVQNGETVDLKMTLHFSDTRREITAGQYFTVKYAYQCNGITRYYNYKVIITQ